MDMVPTHVVVNTVSGSQPLASACGLGAHACHLDPAARDAVATFLDRRFPGCLSVVKALMQGPSTYPRNGRLWLPGSLGRGSRRYQPRNRLAAPRVSCPWLGASAR